MCVCVCVRGMCEVKEERRESACKRDTECVHAWEHDTECVSREEW